MSTQKHQKPSWFKKNWGFFFFGIMFLAIFCFSTIPNNEISVWGKIGTFVLYATADFLFGGIIWLSHTLPPVTNHYDDIEIDE